MLPTEPRPSLRPPRGGRTRGAILAVRWLVTAFLAYALLMPLLLIRLFPPPAIGSPFHTKPWIAAAAGWGVLFVAALALAAPPQSRRL